MNFSLENDEPENNVTQERVPFLFEWKGQGSEVFIVGSFSHWSAFFEMKKNEETGAFEIEILLPRGKHSFKFKVDQKFVCNDQYPIMIDYHNHKVNFIDLTNFNIETKN